MMNTKDFWFVGNSQLISSLVSAFCSVEIQNKALEDWKNLKVTEGQFLFDGKVFRFVSSNMGELGSPSFDSHLLKVSNAFQTKNFAKKVDKNASVIVIMLRGNEFAIESLVNYPCYDFSYKGQLATAGMQLVRESDALEHFNRTINPILASCLIYKSLFPESSIYYVAAPSPIDSEDYIIENPEIFGDLFNTYGVRPFLLRKKIYDAMHDLLSSELSKYGIETIFTPSECLTSRGGLKSDFAHGCLHGNDHYGRALMSKLREMNLYAPV